MVMILILEEMFSLISPAILRNDVELITKKGVGDNTVMSHRL